RPMFHGGTLPFIGDYIDLAAYVLGGTARVRHAVWTDNRDVRAPLGNPQDWTKYTPVHSPSLGNTSIFDPTQQTSNYPCTTDGFGNAVSAGSRNQNIYTTRIDVLVTQDGGALTATISLDPDPTNPDNSAIATNETFNPDVANPDVANPDVANPDVANPDVANPDVANPDVANPDVANPDVA